MDGTVSGFGRGKWFLPGLAIILTKKESTQLQHVVPTIESLIEVPPRLYACEDIPLFKDAPG
jgi:hypothetical protein